MVFERNNFYSLGLIVLFFNISLSQCKNEVGTTLEFSYKINTPDNKYKLEKNLAEVSGLSVLSANEVALIDDEKGSIFFYDVNEGKTIREISFGKEGDYEDLKVINNRAYVLRSDGTLFELKNLNKGTGPLVRSKLSTGLSRLNDTEGLCYDDHKQLLLISCKGKPEKNDMDEKDYKRKKAIYSYDPETKLLSDTPVILIDMEEIEKTAYSIPKNAIQKIISFYTSTEPPSNFEPSGLSIHPFTRDLYIISSVGKVLVVMDSTRVMKHVIKLPAGIFKQPEGIAFDSNGNMYISNEGRGGKGNILKFNYTENPLKDTKLIVHE